MDNNVSFKGGSAPVGTDAGTGATPPPAGSSPAAPMSVADLLQLTSAPTKLSKEGEAYLSTIVEELTKNGFEPKVTQIIGPNYEARVLEYQNYITAFLFAETYIPGVPALPPASAVKDLRSRFASHGVTGTPAIFQVVTKEDYAKVEIMASLVVNAYKCHLTPAFRNFTAAGLSQGNYGLTDDMTLIRPFVERLCPTAALPRMDVGIMLYINQQVTNEFNVGNNGRPEYQRTPILAVTGYTDFVYAENEAINGITGGQIKFVPMFIITGIFTPIVDVSMATVAISLTSYLMIGKSFWAKQFATFQKDKPDIGNLLQNQTTGKPITTTNINERNAVISQYLTTPFPFLAIDVQLGNFTIPGLGKLVDGSAEFNQAVDQFTGCDGAMKAGKACQLVTHNFDGRVRIGKAGDFTDTRAIDYLFLVKAGYQQQEVSSFLRAMQIPAYKSGELAKVYPDAEFLYITYRSFLNPEFVKNVSDDLGRCLKVRIDSTVEAGTYNIGALTGFTNAMGSMPSFAMTSTIGGFTGGWSF